jgi:hypothetical protein
LNDLKAGYFTRAMAILIHNVWVYFIVDAKSPSTTLTDARIVSHF